MLFRSERICQKFRILFDLIKTNRRFSVDTIIVILAFYTKATLEKAIAGLQTVTTDNTVNTPVNTPVNNGDTTASVKTGDESLAGMFATIALLSVAGYAILRRKED